MDVSMSESASSSDVSSTEGSRKKPRGNAQNRRKKRRVRGRGYVTNKNKINIPEKKFLFTVNCCRYNCHQKFNLPLQNEKFKTFYKSDDKEEQDSILMSCTERREIQRATKSAKTKNRKYSWSYSILKDGKKERVCKTFLQKLFQVTDERMKTILRFCKEGKLSALEKRGHHQNRPRTISSEVWQMVKEHWASFPSKSSHYSYNKTNKKYYDNPDLNISILYDLFKEYYKQKTQKELSMKYSTYQKFFKKHSDYSFRSPKTDICDFCAKCRAKLAVNPNDSCKAAYNEHLKKVSEYNELKKMYIFDKNTKNLESKKKLYEDTLVLEFDYAQNLALPKLNINSNYYKRILNLYVFNIHCFNDNDSEMFTFLECDAKKDSNSVCSFLENFVVNKLSANPNFKKVVLFSDAAGGQNKNSNVVKFCTFFAMKYGLEITHIFPVRGHSYCQCDRNFGLYGKKLKRKQKIESPEEYLNIIRTARSGPKPFKAKLSGNLIKNWSASLSEFYGKTPKLKKTTFSIQKYVKLKYNQSNEVLAYTGYNSDHLRFNNSPKKLINFKQLTIPATPKPGINSEKKKDMEFFLEFLTPENRNWLENVIHGESNQETDDMISDEEPESEEE